MTEWIDAKGSASWNADVDSVCVIKLSGEETVYRITISEQPDYPLKAYLSINPIVELDNMRFIFP
jgi:hypothetical protein